mgnify:CR=1 FL=1
MRLERDAFELNELVDRWGIAGADIRYLVASNRMRLSVRIVAQPAVLHAEERTDEDEPFWVPVEETVFSGLGDLALRRDGGICFSHVDLLVRRDCAAALEREVLGVPVTPPEAFDFRLFV